jgi:hypothetical protein
MKGSHMRPGLGSRGAYYDNFPYQPTQLRQSTIFNYFSGYEAAVSFSTPQ